MPEASYSVPTQRLYQSVTMISPSGLKQGIMMAIVLSRMRVTSSSVRVTRSYINSAAIWLAPTSVEWRPIDWTTTAFPCATARSISASGTPRGSLKVALICRNSSSLAKLAGEEMNNTRKGFPQVVGPMFTTWSLGLCSPSRL